DPLGSKLARASPGSLLHILTALEVNIKDVLGKLRASLLQILATPPRGDAACDEIDLSKPTAWRFGNEARCLSPGHLAASDIRVHIPLRGRAESLNLATAASICLYESAKAQNS